MNPISSRNGRCRLAALAVAASAGGVAAAGPLPAMLVPTAASAARAAAPIVAGDLIVKFREASEPGRQLAAVLAGQRSVAAVAPLAARLSAELDLPLVLVQVTSGREALLAVDREALARTLLARAGRETAVRKAGMTVPPPGTGLPSAELVLRIEVHRGTSPAARQALGTRLAVAGLERPRAVNAGSDASLELHYDLDALTLALIAKVQQRPDVEYAQANRLLRPAMPPPAPPAAGASR